MCHRRPCGFRSRRSFAAAILMQAALSCPAVASAALQIPDSVVVNAKVRVDQGWMPGLVIGVVDTSGERFFSYGVTARDGVPVNERTIFEIGSVTKLFTSLALSEMAVRGVVGLDVPVQVFLPDGARMPQFGEHPVTLRHLALHLSGLPEQPPDFGSSDPANPCAVYDSTRLLTFLNSFTLPYAPGERFRYSNLGSGLLGYVLARHESTVYERLVEQYVSAPLGLRDTRIVLSAAQRLRFAQGHGGDGPVPSCTSDALAGAGDLRSTAADIARLLAAASSVTTTPLDSALRLMLGWNQRQLPGGRILYHGGRTGGFRAFVGFDPERRRGVVILANSNEGVDDIGFHLLDSTQPLNPVYRVVPLSLDILDSYLGEYQLDSGAQLRVRREGDQLVAHIAGLGSGRIYPSAPDQFFARATNAQFSFTRAANGLAATVVVLLNGQSVSGWRIN
jgi:serine-type D-Ala-D-Ala carboxypeptidase/endopeptidase